MKKITYVVLLASLGFSGWCASEVNASEYERERNHKQMPVNNTNQNKVKSTGIGVGLGVGVGKARSNSESAARSSAGSEAFAQQQQKQAQKQQQEQGQANTQDSSNNGVAISNVDTHDYQEIPVATAWAPPTMVTAPCVIGMSAGGQVADYGISFGGGFVDTECVLNRDIALYKSMGASDVMLHQVMCQKDSYRTASANIDGMECPEYVNETATALLPIRDKVFGATTLKELAAKGKEACFDPYTC